LIFRQLANGKDIFAAIMDKHSSVVAKLVVMVVFEGAEILDIAGPASVFGKANIFSPGSYDFRVVAETGGQVVANSGITIISHGGWESIVPDSIDTLIIVGGPFVGVLQELAKGRLAPWIASVAPCVRRIVSVCTGAFALGQAGLLDGRSATTHWDSVDLLQDYFPSAAVKSNKIYVKDGKIWTSAGILTGIDLSLALVEDDLGRALALEIANLLVLAGMRPGDSPQRSALLASQAQVSNPLRELLSWIQLNMTEDLSSTLLAERMGLSDRHFRRIFQNETGVTPAVYVSTCRLNHAALLLRNTNWSVESVASKSGFDSIDTLQRGFVKHWGVSPTEYRTEHKLPPRLLVPSPLSQRTR
jgi:transcriptional regulator GlxA family with amidase domain